MLDKRGRCRCAPGRGGPTGTSHEALLPPRTCRVDDSHRCRARPRGPGVRDSAATGLRAACPTDGVARVGNRRRQAEHCRGGWGGAKAGCRVEGCCFVEERRFARDCSCETGGCEEAGELGGKPGRSTGGAAEESVESRGGSRRDRTCEVGSCFGDQDRSQESRVEEAHQTRGLQLDGQRRQEGEARQEAQGDAEEDLIGGRP